MEAVSLTAGIGRLDVSKHTYQAIQQIDCALLPRLTRPRTHSSWNREDVCVRETTATPRVGTGLSEATLGRAERAGLGVRPPVCGSTPVSSSVCSFVLGNVVLASKVLSAYLRNPKGFLIAIRPLLK